MSASQRRPDSASSSLPDRPNFRHLKLQAKRLRDDSKANDPDALARVASALPHRTGPLTLREAQFVVAREYGFASWTRLKNSISRPTESSADQDGLSKVHGIFADRLSGILSDALDSTSVGLSQTASQKYGALLDPSDSGWCAYRVPLLPAGWPLDATAPVVIEFGLPLIARLLGETTITSGTVSKRRSELTPVARRVFNDFGSIWSGQKPMQIGDAWYSTRPTDHEIARPGDECLVAVFDTRGRDWHSHIRVCYPEKTLTELILPSLNEHRVDHFEQAEPGNQRVAALFANHTRRRLDIDRVLTGEIGTVLVDDSQSPTVAHLVNSHGESFFGGDVSSPLAKEAVETRRSVRLVPASDAWAELIARVYPSADRETMIEWSAELDTDHLAELAQKEPEVRILEIDTRLGQEITRNLHPQLYSGFDSEAVFFDKGLGYCAVIDDHPVCCVSTQWVFGEHTKLNLEFDDARSNFDIELGVSAASLRACLSRGLVPHWRWVSKMDGRLGRLGIALGLQPNNYEIYVPGSGN